jgi:glycosyltransferase involved in cell wall biosynthesis
MMVMKIILIRSDSINPDVRAEKEAKSLAKFGHDVTILGWNRSDDCKKIEHKNGYTIHRLNFKAPYGTISLIPYLVIWNLYILFILTTRKYDIIHSCNLDTLIPSLIVGKMKRKKIVYDIFDFYGHMLPKSTSNLFRNIVSYFERSLSHFADVIILADESRIVQLGSMNHKKIEYILNTPEYAKFKGKTIKSKNYVIFYGGVLIETRGLRQILEIVERSGDMKLIVAGYGTDESILISLFNKCRNVEYIGKISYEEIIENTYAADFLFALYDPIIPNNKFASPNKLFEAMMCGKPIIVSAETSMARIVERDNCGKVVPYGDIKKITETIILLKNNPDLCRRLGENGRRAYEERYSWKIMEKKLINLYNNFRS